MATVDLKNYQKRKRLKRFLVATVIVSIFAYCTIIYFDKYGDNSPAIVQIRGQKITENEISDKISEIFAANQPLSAIPEVKTLPKEVIETFAKEIYLEKRLVKMAERSGVEKQRKVRNKIRQTKNRILIDAFLQEKIAKATTEEKLKEKYLEISNNLQGKREYKISHIVVDNEKLAYQIYKIYKRTPPIRRDRRFVSLAKKYSSDKESAKSGGKLGFVLEDNIAKEVMEELALIKKFGYTKPIKTNFGWHIVKVDAIRDAKIAPYDQAKPQIKQQIIKEITDGIYQKIFKKAKVKFLTNIKEPKAKRDE